MAPTKRKALASRQNGLNASSAKKARLDDESEKENSGSLPRTRTAAQYLEEISGHKETIRALSETVSQLTEACSLLRTERATLKRDLLYWRSKPRAPEPLPAPPDTASATTIAELRTKVSRLQDLLFEAREERNKARISAQRTRDSREAFAEKRAREALQVFVKESGEVPEHLRAMIRDMYCIHNVPMKHVFAVAQCAWEAAGLTVHGSFSHGLVALCIREAGFAAQLQIIDAIQSCKGMVLSSDGTTDRNLHYQSYHATLKMLDDSTRTLFLGLKRQAVHTSEQQLLDWEALLNEIRATWNLSPLGQHAEISLNYILALCCGTNFDHAAEMKKLNRLLQELKRRVDRLARGQEVIDNLNDLQYQALTAEVLRDIIAAEGGDAAWDALSAERQAELYQAGLDAVALKLGQQRFSELPEAVQARVDLWFWFGCTMHKELNAVKAGSDRMAATWKELNATPPMKFINKDNTAAIRAGSSAAKERAESTSQGGGAKLAYSLGSLLRNKENKKGYQRTFNNFMLEELGFAVQYPNTGRSRFHTTTGASAFIMLHSPSIIDFLGFAYWKKEKPGFTNFEQNCYSGLLDDPTRTESAVLAVCHEVLSIPYVAESRASGVNATTLGPLHDRVRALCRKLAREPSLLVDSAPDVSYLECTLDGRPYAEIDVIYAVLEHYRAGRLPHFLDILTAFFEGCGDKFADFSTEFAPDAPLANTPEELLDSVFFPSTNDRNESTLGQMRGAHRDAPNIADFMLNSKLMYKLNDVGPYMKTLPPPCHDYIRRAARDRETLDRKRRDDTSETAHFKQTALEHRELARQRMERDIEEKRQRLARLDKLEQDGTLIRDPDEVRDRRLTVKDLDVQLEWHRWRGLPEGHEHKIPAAKNAHKNKEQKVEALIKAVRALRDLELHEASLVSVSVEDVFVDVPYVDQAV